MNRTRIVLAIGILLAWGVLVVLLPTGCGHPAQQRNARIFVIAQTSEPRTLDPLLESGYTTEEIGSLVYSYLVRIDASGQLEPDLAERVPTTANGDISRDGRTIVYHLRHGVRWHDGHPFTAADIVATFRAVMNPRNPVPTRLGFDRVVDIRALDAATLRVRLNAQFAPFLTYFFETENYPILPAHLLARIETLAGSMFDAAPIGTGPFRVKSWHRGDNLELDANADYFRGAPKLARLRIEFIPSAQSIVVRLETGEAQAYLAADPFVARQLHSFRRFRRVVVPIYGFLSLSLQTRDPALRDPAVRRAIAHAFDFGRDITFASHGTMNTGDAGRGLFTWAYVPRRIPSSSARLPQTFTLSIDVSRPLERTLAVVMQQEARRSGGSLVIRAYAPQQFEATAVGEGPLASGNYQLALHEILTGADPETSWLLACSQIPPAGYNISRFCEPQVDRALSHALVTNDRAQRTLDYVVVQDAVARDVPFVAISQLREIEVIPTGMRGFQPSLETPFYRAERWQP
jgi:peptide/nickel transport system substrate-binding protein